MALGEERTKPREEREARDTTLRVVAFTDRGSAVYELGSGARLTVGRADDSDVCLVDGSVSRHHAVLYGGPPPRIEDLGSTNGTTVGGQPIALGLPVAIAPLTPVQIGDSLLVVRAMSVLHEPPLDPPSHAGGQDPAMARVQELVELVSGSIVSVLLLGETGVGKGVVAEAIQRRSPRADRPFVRVNCAALADGLLESELFGHVRGAFTGASQAKPGLLEAADTGTILLDEIGDMPLAAQAKLLHAVEHGETLPVGGVTPRRFDVRFIAATNCDLAERIAAGRFRQDLFFRLNAVTILVPPLRERRSEIASLARHFLAEACSRLGCRPAVLSEAALALIVGYEWPGNVRELRNAMVRAALFAQGGRVGVDHFELGSLTDAAPKTGAQALHGQVRALELKRVVEALERCGYNQVAAAKWLGIARGTLRSRMLELGLLGTRKG